MGPRCRGGDEFRLPHCRVGPRIHYHLGDTVCFFRLLGPFQGRTATVCPCSATVKAHRSGSEICRLLHTCVKMRHLDDIFSQCEIETELYHLYIQSHKKILIICSTFSHGTNST